MLTIMNHMNHNYWSNGGVVTGAITSIIILLFIFKKLYPKIVLWRKSKYYRYAPKSDLEILKDRLNQVKRYE